MIAEVTDRLETVETIKEYLYDDLEKNEIHLIFKESSGISDEEFENCFIEAYSTL